MPEAAPEEKQRDAAVVVVAPICWGVRRRESNLLGSRLLDSDTGHGRHGSRFPQTRRPPGAVSPRSSFLCGCDACKCRKSLTFP